MGWKLEAGVADRTPDAIAALAHARVRKTHHREQGQAERNVDLHVDRTGVNAKHRRGGETRKHADAFAKRVAESLVVCFQSVAGDSVFLRRRNRGASLGVARKNRYAQDLIAALQI